LLNFQKFRDVCFSLNCGEHVSELWQELDPNRGGCISLWELDADAVSLLLKLRKRMLSVLGSNQKASDKTAVEVPEDVDVNVLFARLTSFVRPIQLGSLELHEFRVVAKPLGLSQQEADRVFACLDHFPGSMYNPPSTIDINDIQWLKKITALVDIDAVTCASDVSLAIQSGTPLSNVTGSPMPLASPLSSSATGPMASPDSSIATTASPQRQGTPAKTAGPGGSPQRQEAEIGAKRNSKDASSKQPGKKMSFTEAHRLSAGKDPSQKSAIASAVASAESKTSKEPANTPATSNLGSLGVEVDDEEEEDQDEEEEEEWEEEGEEEEDAEGDEEEEDGEPDAEETW